MSSPGKCPVFHKSKSKSQSPTSHITEEGIAYRTDDDNDDDVRSVTSTSDYSDLDGGQADVLEAFCEVIMDAAIIIDKRGLVKNVNAACLEMFGYDRWEVSTHNIRKLMPPEIARNHDGYLKRYNVERVKKIIGETRGGLTAQRKDGSQFPVELRIIEVNSTKFGGSVFLGTIRDQTQADALVLMNQNFDQKYPPGVRARLRAGETEISYNLTTIVGYIDCCDFTKRSEEVEPDILLVYINRLFGGIHQILQSAGFITIKTIGDCIMFITNENNSREFETYEAKSLLLVNQIMNKYSNSRELMHDYEDEFGDPMALHIGLAKGRVTAGVLSGALGAFDVWGSTCNRASRLLNLAGPGRICVDKNMMTFSSSHINFRASRERNVKGIGDLDVYTFVDVKEMAKSPRRKKKKRRKTHKHNVQSNRGITNPTVKKEPVSTQGGLTLPTI